MSDIEANKETVVAYYQMAFEGNPENAVAQYFGDRYIQHNPEAQDGPEAFIGFVHYLRKEFPDLRLDIKRVIAEGDLVVTHSHLILKPGDPGRALADFFRLRDGKVVGELQRHVLRQGMEPALRVDERHSQLRTQHRTDATPRQFFPVVPTNNAGARSTTRF